MLRSIALPDNLLTRARESEHRRTSRALRELLGERAGDELDEAFRKRAMVSVVLPWAPWRRLYGELSAAFT